MVYNAIGIRCYIPPIWGCCVFCSYRRLSSRIGHRLCLEALAHKWDFHVRDIRSPPTKKISFSPSENPFVRAEPDIIKGPDFCEILVEVKGISDLSDVKVDFEPQNTLVRITDNKTKFSQVLANLPEDVSRYKLRDIDYLNGIIRVRLG